MQLHKIKQYNVFELVHILLYRLVYSARLVFRKTLVLLINPQYVSIKDDNAETSYQRLTSSLYNYYGFLSSGNGVITEAEILANGNTRVFGQLFPFNPSEDWLKDPVTRNMWPKDVFWSNAKFVEKNLADVKYVLEINKLNDIVVFAQAYYYSKDTRFIKLIDIYISGWLRCVPREKSVANKIVMDLGFRVINLIHISLLCYDNKYFRDIIHPKILGIIKQHSSHLWKNLSSRWFKSRNDNNHNLGEIVGLYVGQLWINQFSIGRGYLTESHIKKEIKFLKTLVEKLIGPSGVYKEQSSNYTRVVHDFLLMFEIFRHSLDYNRDFSWFEKSGYFNRLSSYLFELSYHGHLPNFGDNDFARSIIPFEELNDQIAPVRKHICPCDTCNYLVDGQWLFKSKDKNEVFLFTRVGKFASFVEGAFVHSHNDIMSLLMCVKGQEVFIDKGTYFYNSGFDIRREFTSIAAHNTVQVGSREMADYLPIGYSNYPRTNIIDKSNEFGFLFCGEVSYKDIVHERALYYDKDVITVTDTISKTSLGKENCVLRFLLAETIITEKKNDELLLLNMMGDIICVVSFANVDNWNVVNTVYAPHYGLQRQTYMIEAYSEIQELKQIKTIIRL